MPLSKTERDYLIGTINEMMGDALAVSRWPRITEDEWSERFGELPHPDDDNLEKDITEKILAEWQKRQPRHRTAATTLNQSESYQRSANEVIRASQVQRGIEDAQNDALNPFQSNYQF